MLKQHEGALGRRVLDPFRGRPAHELTERAHRFIDVGPGGAPRSGVVLDEKCAR